MSEGQPEGAKAEQAAQPPAPPPADVPPDIAATAPRRRSTNPEMERVLDVKVEASVELGRRRMSIAEVLEMAPNTVMEFLKKADEPLDIRVNGRLIARGEAVVLGDRYGVRVTEIIAPSSFHGRIEVGDLAP